MVRIHPSAPGKKYMKTLGIIGGFGPETTAQFQLAIIERCRTLNSNTRPEIIMWNAPIPLHIEENLIMRSLGIDEFLPFLVNGARILEKAGATFLVLPCNSLHTFIKRIRSSVRIPMLDMTDITISHLIDQQVKNIAIFSTRITKNNNLHIQKLQNAGISVILPTEHEQNAIDQVILDILNIKAHKRATRVLHAIAMDCIQRGADDILLACTDLQIVFPKLKEASVHDTMHLLADACVREILR